MPESGPSVPCQPFLSVPTWDITDEEISEWSKTPSKGLAGLAAERIRDGHYDNGQEIYPLESPMYREITRQMVDQQMELLAERGMARKTGGKWHAIAPGRMEPSIRRAVTVLLARRDDLPPGLTAELDSWKLTLDALEAPGSTSASHVPAQRAARPARPAHQITTG